MPKGQWLAGRCSSISTVNAHQCRRAAGHEGAHRWWTPRSWEEWDDIKVGRKWYQTNEREGKFRDAVT